MKVVIITLLVLSLAGCYVRWKQGNNCYAFAMPAFDDPCKEEPKEKSGDAN